RNGVLSRTGKDFPAVGERDVTAGRVERSVFRPEALDLNNVTRLQYVSGNPAALQHTRRTAGKSPRCDLSAFVLHIDVEPDVRIVQFPFLHTPVTLSRFCRIVFG